jgi:PadR family transcriptional regulator AphA
MNTLSYGLLGLLTRRELSGYDLMLEIQHFWQANHSQIYPLLAMLEKKQLVQFVLVPQTDKPDKKVYSITDAGLSALKEWIGNPTPEPATRDELLLKTCCIWLSDKPAAHRLFADRSAMYREKQVLFNNKLQKLKQECSDPKEYLDIASPKFGLYILMEKGVRNAQSNIEWCEWAISLLQTKEQ